MKATHMKVSTELCCSIRDNFLSRSKKDQCLIRLYILETLSQADCSFLSDSMVLEFARIQLKNPAITEYEKANLINPIIIVHYVALAMKYKQLSVTQIYDFMIENCLRNQNVVDEINRIEKAGLL